ncbi:hypothetical protein ZZ1p0039 [Acinetobacter phage ZZ1]|uniref:Uncharacterized protein n=3 Tax=Caudoviricetes TaxID=2731619 RepID=A0A410T5R2_9CAUD|nr:hypothetical protein ZZ1p0039 [Acinetobacter phage ZZ1]AFL47585.1 hypothetical protein ZZ1p0039 [Acinetobacter phage ZZ1]QAU04078.1 hypothetical protein Henu6_gp98 [Acinetobacter phage Henu6]
MKRIETIGFISAFPGTGKSSIYGNAPKNGLYPVRANGTAIFRMVPGPGDAFVYDSDSSTFDKAEFPGNYIQHMREIIHRHAGDNYLVMVSSHAEVREEMQKVGIPYVLVYPDRSLKGEYIERYKRRGSPEGFIKLMDEKWDDFIDTCEFDTQCDKIVLGPYQYLSDVL